MHMCFPSCGNSHFASCDAIPNSLLSSLSFQKQPLVPQEESKSEVIKDGEKQVENGEQNSAESHEDEHKDEHKDEKMEEETAVA